MNRPVTPADTADAVELPLTAPNPVVQDEATPEQVRALLINGSKDFERKFPDWQHEEAAERELDRIAYESRVAAGIEFDWLESKSVVIHEQPATAMYFNPGGHLVIRQKADWDREEDTFVYIAPNNIEAFIDELTEMVGIPSVGGPTKSSAQAR